MLTITQATAETLSEIWEYNIRNNADDSRWIRWREEAIANHISGRTKTFLIIIDGVPVGEVTLIFSPECSAIDGRTDLADGKTIANINALRIRKEYEGMGYVSAMMKQAEAYARETGITELTIGVDAAEARNLAIYLHWGYTKLIRYDVEDEELVLYYGKKLAD